MVVTAAIIRPESSLALLAACAVLIASLILLAQLFIMRYRMHRGVYGQHPRETRDFDRWMELREAKKLPPRFNLPD